MKGIDKSYVVCYSGYMVRKTLCISLPVKPGATKEWVVAQREEMKKRIYQDLDEYEYLVGVKYRLQYTYKGQWPVMTVIGEGLYA